MAGQRQAELVPIPIERGLYSVRSPRASVNRWRDGQNVRWVDGLPEKVGGFVPQALVDEEGNEVTYYGRARTVHEWNSLDGQNWLAFGTQCKLYLVNNNTLYDITPLRRQISLTNAISTANGSSTITIVDANHDAQAGDHFRIEGATEVGGITLSGEYSIASVIDPDTFTIEVEDEADATETGGGNAITIRYDISCGLESDGFLYGFGVGDFGEETFGTPRSTSTFRGFARVWSLGNWGEDLIASPNGGTIYVWRKNTGPQSRAVAVPGAPENCEHVLIGPDERHVIALGANLASTGIQDRMFVRWSAGDNYEDWIITDTNDAGSKRLGIGSRLITAVKTNRQVLNFTDKAAYVTSIVGGQDVYSITHVGDIPEIISKNAALDVDGVVYAMMVDDFYYFDGRVTVLPCDIHNLVFGRINKAHRSKVHAHLVREFNEIHWSVPLDEATENSHEVIFNYADKCWSVTTLGRESAADRSNQYGYPLGLKNGVLYLHENGKNADGATLDAYLESWEWDVANGSTYTMVTELLGDFIRLVGTMTVTLFGRNDASNTRTTGPARTITAGSTRITPKFRQQQVGFRLSITGVDCDFRFDLWRGKFVFHGRR